MKIFSHRMTDLIGDGGVCRTALATPGLLITKRVTQLIQVTYILRMALINRLGLTLLVHPRSWHTESLLEAHNLIKKP